MKDSTSDGLLHRQVPPHLEREKRPAWEAFKPKPKDKGRLSVSCGRQLEAREAYARYVARKNPKGVNLRSAGVRSVLRSECASIERAVIADPLEDDPAHTIIDFNGLDELGVELAAQRLHSFAEARGWCFRPEVA